MKSPLYKHLPPLNSLLVFEVAARKQSFRHAGIELSITPSAVAHHIRLLEADLNIVLFIRLARGVYLSSEGKEYFAKIQPILHQINEHSKQLSHHSARPLKILTHHAVAQLWLQKKLGEYQLNHPQYEIEITATTSLADLPQDIGIAIAFFAEPPKDSNWDMLWEETIIPVCAPSYNEPHQPVLYQDMFWSDDWAQWKARAKSAVTSPVKFKQIRRNSMYVLAVNLAIEGLGVMVARRSLLASELESKALIPWRVKSDEYARYGAYYLYQSPEAKNDPIAQQFCIWLRSKV